MAEPSVHIVELAAEQTHALRSSVLRDGTPSATLHWDGDDLATTTHLGVVLDDDDTPVAISTWLLAPSPDAPTGPAVSAPVGRQLRGMATAPSVRGTGIGALLLLAGVERAERDGADHVWANARSTVLDFYLRHGFTITSDEFLSAETAIAHRRILRHFI